MTYNLLHMEGGENYLKNSGPQLIRFGSEGILKIWRKRMSYIDIQLMNDKGVCGTDPATPGLLNMEEEDK